MIPHDDESFDFILCNHVLEHVPDDNLAMRELFRVMSQSGGGLFQVPIDYDRKKHMKTGVLLPQKSA